MPMTLRDCWEIELKNHLTFPIHALVNNYPLVMVENLKVLNYVQLTVYYT